VGNFLLTNVRICASALLTAAAIFGNCFACPAAPTPVPGGANQVKAVSGFAGEPMWNGVLRYKVQELRDARPEDHPETLLPGPNQKVMVFRASLRNGTAKQFAELLSYTLIDMSRSRFPAAPSRPPRSSLRKVTTRASPRCSSPTRASCR
jgi:hypothetical protein